MFRFYSIFFNLYSLSVYFYCIIFVYIVYSLYNFGFVFNIWPFLFDLTLLLLYIFGFVLYNSDLYSIYFDICIESLFISILYFSFIFYLFMFLLYNCLFTFGNLHLYSIFVHYYSICVYLYAMFYICIQ